MDGTLLEIILQPFVMPVIKKKRDTSVIKRKNKELKKASQGWPKF